MQSFHTETYTVDGPVPASATVSVYVQDTESLAAIYDPATGEAKANPFVITDGMLAFAAARGRYRILIDDGSPYDLDHISIGG